MSVITKEQLETMVKGILNEQNAVFNEDQLTKFQQVIEGKFTEWSQTVEKKFVPQDVGKLGTNGFTDIAEFAHAVYKADKSHGRNFDPRLLVKAAGSPAQSENDDEGGGYLVPPEFRAQLFQLTLEKSDILGKAMVIPMAANTVNIPVVNGFDRSGGLVHGGITYYWVDEEGAYTSSRMKFQKIGLTLKKIIGMSYMSDEILEDSPISMTPLVTGAFSDGLVWALEDVFINGSGAGKPMGVMNAPCLISVAKETGQAASTIVFENILKMYSRMWSDKNAMWMANRACLPQLATMSLAVGTGGIPVYMPAGGAAGAPYATLMGLPLTWCEHCAALGTVGDVLLADWSQYLVGQKAGAGAGVKTATSIHLKFDYDQMAFKISTRLDGQPWWPSVSLPHYGGNSLSPFVVVATRA